MNQNTVNPLYIFKQHIFRDSEFFKYNIDYPILMPMIGYNYNYFYNMEVLSNINQIIYLDIINFKNKVKKEAKEYKKEYENVLSKSNNDYVKYQYEVYIEYKVTYNRNNIISIPIQKYKFTGGAHGMTYLDSYNYNLVNGKRLNLSDMFKDNVDYKKIINDYIYSEINKNPDLYFQGSDGFTGIRDNQPFYIESDGVVIYFDLYEIAPYYVGIPKFKMSFRQFLKYFKSILRKS